MRARVLLAPHLISLPRIPCAQPPQGYREDDGLLLESDTDEQLVRALGVVGRWVGAWVGGGLSVTGAHPPFTLPPPPPPPLQLIHIPFNSACKLSGLVIKSSGTEGQVRRGAGCGGGKGKCAER